jgi:hypothetical protein
VLTFDFPDEVSIINKQTVCFMTQIVALKLMLDDYWMSTMEHPQFIVFSGSKEQRYGPMVDKKQSHNRPSLILKISPFLREVA